MMKIIEFHMIIMKIIKIIKLKARIKELMEIFELSKRMLKIINILRIQSQITEKNENLIIPITKKKNIVFLNSS